MKLLSWMVALCIVVSAKDVHAQKKKNERVTITDPAKAGEDFAIQGEYVGDLPSRDGGKQPWGVQVIALGNHQFRAVAHPGGLPGAGWNGEEKIIANGKTENGVTKLKSEMGYAIIKDQVMTIFHSEDEKLGTLKKVHRKSTTLGKKPPQDAIILYDGKKNDFKPGDTVENLLSVDKATQRTQHIFDKDFTLHLEFRTPFRSWARGQGRGNSGVYLQGRYEVQVLDSFGLEGKRNECGGLYGRKDCDINMCYPPLSWQTYDIDFTVAKFDKEGKQTSPAMITVRHNDVVIHKNVKLGRGNKRGGPITLQKHGNPVVYRNIWAMEK